MGEEQEGVQEASEPDGLPTGVVLSRDPGSGGQVWGRVAETKAGMVRAGIC